MYIYIYIYVYMYVDKKMESTHIENTRIFSELYSAGTESKQLTVFKLKLQFWSYKRPQTIGLEV